MRRLAVLPFALCLLPLLGSGCAKSPAGVVTTPAINRFETVVTLAGTLNPTYYYAVAFDDTGTSSQGPVAIDSSTPVLNGVMGGTFRLLVLYNSNTFRVFYRSTPSDTSTEREITGTTNLFNTGQTPRATTSGLDLTINLDAQLPDNTYIFPRATGTQTSPPSIGASSFNINVACTNTTLVGGSQNTLVKPVDALGDETLSTPVQIQIDSTRTTTVSDPTGDERPGIDSSFTTPGSGNYVDFSQIDITGLQINITRF